MLRAFFSAVGITLLIVGGECLVIERAVLAETKQQVTQNTFMQSALQSATAPTQSGRVVQPPEWAPWTLLSAGAVILLYSWTVARE